MRAVSLESFTACRESLVAFVLLASIGSLLLLFGDIENSGATHTGQQFSMPANDDGSDLPVLYPEGEEGAVEEHSESEDPVAEEELAVTEWPQPVG